MQVFDPSFDGRRVELPTGTAFELALPERPTTGFRWKIVSNHTAEVDKTDPPPPEPGAATVRRLRFRVNRDFDSPLRLELRRSGEHTVPVATFTLHLDVR
jgi:predicted secreted protein